MLVKPRKSLQRKLEMSENIFIMILQIEVYNESLKFGYVITFNFIQNWIRLVISNDLMVPYRTLDVVLTNIHFLLLYDLMVYCKIERNESKKRLNYKRYQRAQFCTIF